MAGALLLFAVVSAPRVAAADRQELQVTVAPGVSVLSLDGSTTLGTAAVLGARVGTPWHDALAWEVTAHWNRLPGIPIPEEELMGFATRNASRLGLTASPLLRLGHRVVLSLGLGLGYRRETLVNAKPKGLVPRDPGAQVRQWTVGVVTAGLEWRFRDRFSSALWGRADVLGQGSRLDASGGLAMSLYLWP